MKDYDEYLEERLDGMYSILESSNNELMEGFLSKMKEKRAAKKAAKEEKRILNLVEDLIVIDENKLPYYEKEYNKLVQDMKTLLKREVPGCTFINQEVKHTSMSGAGYEIHRFYLKLFELDDANFDRFKSKSKYEELKNAENTWDAVDELLQDTADRIGKPLESKGFSYDENRLYAKPSNGKDYLFVDLGDETAFDVVIMMDIAVKKNKE